MDLIRRRVLKEIANDDQRSLIVIDPRRTETADLADYWLQVKPGTDAFLLAALAAILVYENLLDNDWLDANANGVQETKDAFRSVPIDEYAERSGVPLGQLYEVARRIAQAKSVSTYEDLGIEMGPHSTLISYLHRVVSILTGNYGNLGRLGLTLPSLLCLTTLLRVVNPQIQSLAEKLSQASYHVMR